MDAFIRARRPEQKESRRAHLLATARAMLQSGTPLDGVALNELARRADMTKSNVYRYFETKEHVLLDLLREEWAVWLSALLEGWPFRRSPALAKVAAYLASTVAAQPLLCQLTTALPTVLEHNLSDEEITRFKRESRLLLAQAADFLAEKLPGLSADRLFTVLNDAVALITGLWPYAHPSPAVQRVLASDPTLCVFVRDFEKDLARLLSSLMVALERPSRAVRPGDGDGGFGGRRSGQGAR